MVDYYDSETGLYYLNSRYYDPVVGRFINADGFVTTGQGLGSTNMYSYCGNNPIIRSDNNGDFWGIVVAGLLAGLAAVAGLTGCSAQPPKPPDYRDEKRGYVNCYPYAFDIDIDSGPINPGDISAKNESDKMIIRDPQKDRYSVEEVAAYVKRDMDYLGRTCKEISSPTEAKSKNTYVVALKVATDPQGDFDYHFAVQLSDGKWADKQGELWSRYAMIDGEAKRWDSFSTRGYYNSETIYFEVWY